MSTVIPLRTMIRPHRALASCQAGMAAAQLRLGRAVGRIRDHAGGSMTGLRRPRAIADAAVSLLATLRRSGGALARLGQAPPSFRVALAASILLHVGGLVGLVALQRSAPRPVEEPAIAVNLTPEDPAARVGARAGVDWESPAGQAALAALLEARREAALMSELVIAPARRPRAAGRPSAPAPVSAPSSAAARAEPSIAPPAPPTPRPPAPATAALEPPAVAPAPVASGQPAAPAPPTPATGARIGAQPDAPAAAPVPATNASADAVADADPSYLDAVFERLKRLKDYPGLAKYRTSGRVLVAFTVARDGTVLSAEVRRSSGYSFLDKAGLDLIRRASPLPALPASLPRESLAILIPINFWYE